MPKICERIERERPTSESGQRICHWSWTSRQMTQCVWPDRAALLDTKSCSAAANPVCPELSQSTCSVKLNILWTVAELLYDFAIYDISNAHFVHRGNIVSPDLNTHPSGQGMVVAGWSLLTTFAIQLKFHSILSLAMQLSLSLSLCPCPCIALLNLIPGCNEPEVIDHCT